MNYQDIQNTVIDYEMFKLEAYISSGVFPKRYFGYFDEKWDTQKEERILKDTVHRSVKLINDYQKKRNKTVRLTDIAVAITFISEGGAILLREKQKDLNRIHPVMGIGLDSIKYGFKKHPELIETLDKKLNINLKSILKKEDGKVYISRYFTFKEAIASTALMYLYEKEICERKLKKRYKVNLSKLSLDKQFIYSSIAYNSGLTISSERMEMIRKFTTGRYLYDVSEKSKKRRWALNILPPKLSFVNLIEQGKYLNQPTEWSTVYHILQRYGGYYAMKKFRQVFDTQGFFN